MIYYHGSSVQVSSPDVLHSGKRLDFGKGFYVTTVKEQAIRWAKRKAAINGADCGIVSSYVLKESDGFRVLDFADDLESWIDFVCQCRDGNNSYQNYDVIKGKVADDKVFRVVDMYKREIWDKQRAIQEIRVYKTYDQIAFIHQEAIDAMLQYQGCFEVTL